MRDFILRVPDDCVMEDRTRLKKAVASLFGDRHDGARPAYLYSIDPLIDVGPWVRVRLLANDLPPAAQGFAQPVSVPAPKVGDRVVAVAWVALKSKLFHRSEPRAEVAARLGRVRELFEAAIEIETYDFDPDYRVARMERGSDRFMRAYSRVEAAGTIRDELAAQDLLTLGIGASKAYGFGLVDIRIAEDRA